MSNAKLHQSRYILQKDGTKFDLLNGANEKTCPVCAQPSTGSLVYDFDDFKIVRCQSCTTLHLFPVPSSAAISILYNTNYYKDDTGEHGYADYGANERYIKRTYRARLTHIKKIISGRNLKRMHEIGCAFGFGLDEAKVLFPGMTITGSDISVEAIASARAKGFSCFESDTAGRFSVAEKFDAIYLFDVIEHLTDVKGFLDWIDTILDKGGILAFTTPDMGSFLNRMLGMRSPSIKIPQHISYFTTETLVKQMQDRYDLAGSFVDYQHLSLGHLVTRVLHMLGLPHWPWLETLQIPILAPTGMKLYVFQKKA